MWVEDRGYVLTKAESWSSGAIYYMELTFSHATYADIVLDFGDSNEKTNSNLNTAVTFSNHVDKVGAYFYDGVLEGLYFCEMGATEAIQLEDGTSHCTCAPVLCTG